MAAPSHHTVAVYGNEDDEEEYYDEAEDLDVTDLNSTRNIALEHHHLIELEEKQEEERQKQEMLELMEEAQGEVRVAQLAAGRKILQEADEKSSSMNGKTQEEKDSIALDYIETILDRYANDDDDDGTLNRIALDAHIEGVFRNRNLLAILLDGRKSSAATPTSTSAAPAAPAALPQSNIPHLMQQQRASAVPQSPPPPPPPRLLHTSPKLRTALLHTLNTAHRPRYRTYNPAVTESRELPFITGSSHYIPTIYDSFLRCLKSWQPKPINAEGDQFLTDLLTALLKTESPMGPSIFFPLTQLVELIFIDKFHRVRYMHYYNLIINVGLPSMVAEIPRSLNRHDTYPGMMVNELLRDPGANKYKFTPLHIIFKSYQIDALIDLMLLIPLNILRHVKLSAKPTTFKSPDHQNTLLSDATYTASKSTTVINGKMITMIQRLCGYVILAIFQWQQERLKTFPSTPSDVKLQINAKTCHVTFPSFRKLDSLHDFLRKMREYVNENRVKLEFDPYDTIVPASLEAAALMALSNVNAASASTSTASTTSSTTAIAIAASSTLK